MILVSHVPQATYTTVLDTPEARRLAENSKLQSNIKYHEDYERTKGRVTQVGYAKLCFIISAVGYS